MFHALITGANRGLGLEHARQLLERGWHVTAAVRDPDAASELKALPQGEGKLDVVAYDATDLDAPKRLAAEIDGPIDLLFANAGMMSPETRSFGSAAGEAMALEFRVNAIAPLALVEAFADKVAASEMKVVALQSSRMGSIADNGSGGGYGYRGSKAALNAIGKSLSHDLADRGIVVLILHPGWVRTDMGGPNGQLTVQESVEGQLDLIARAYGNPAMSGRFFHVSGQDLPW
ncbi:SDR family oxidoreductase [Maricaulis sp.]|uniref:SDR family oxidoreductase n=1 Tax=Maricaulis sp. TaxID=1486257 RepID=UPI001B0164A0|nr:SDR family oxidoreductase [Maricaulis sp.]MBO6765645.1 SDR family oxidoreductase [Maricaulis sp.]